MHANSHRLLAAATWGQQRTGLLLSDPGQRWLGHLQRRTQACCSFPYVGVFLVDRTLKACVVVWSTRAVFISPYRLYCFQGEGLCEGSASSQLLDRFVQCLLLRRLSSVVLVALAVCLLGHMQFACSKASGHSHSGSAAAVCAGHTCNMCDCEAFQGFGSTAACCATPTGCCGNVCGVGMGEDKGLLALRGQSQGCYSNVWHRV